MPSTIITKNGSGAPLAADLVAGELAVDLTNGRLYTDDGSSVIEIGLNPSGNVDVTGTVTADGLTVGDSSSSFTLATIQSSTSGESELRMGDTDTDAGSISYTNSDDTMTFRAAAAARMSLNSTGLDVTGTVTADGLTVDSSSGITVNGPTNQDGKLNLVAYAGVQDAEARIQAARGNTSGTDSRLQFLTNNGTSLLTRVDINDNGDISFYEDTGTTAKLFWDASAESLGIGTSSPTGLLTLGTGTFSAAAANTSALYTSTTAGLVAVADGFLLVDRAGADVFKVDTSGNVGIDVVPSSWSTVRALQVGHAHVGALVDNAYFGANSYYDGSNWRYIATNEANRIDMQAGNIQFWTAPSGTAGSVISQTQAMTLDASGSLLVGTASAISGNKHCFVDSTIDTTVIIQKSSSDASYLPLAVWHTATSGNNLFVKFFTEGSATERGNIDYNRTGNQVRYNVTSDQRLKENIVDASSASDDIDAIKVRQFDWVENGYHQSYGLIAQELLTVVPDAVSSPEDPEEMMGVDYSKLVPMMLKEIQSLRARVAQLEGVN